MISPPAPSRHVVGLLIAITVLLSLLVVGLAVGGFVALRYGPEALSLAREMRQEIRGMRQDLVATREATRELSAEVDRVNRTAREATLQFTQRQRHLSVELQDRARQTLVEMDGIQARRARVPERNPFNPLAKLDAIADLNRIMADELVILNRHLGETQADLATMLRPLPIQQKLESTPVKPRAR